MPLFLRFFPASSAPSMLARMPLAEFAVRSQCACPLPPIFYRSQQGQQQQQPCGSDCHLHSSTTCAQNEMGGNGEFYYMQTPLPKAVAQDCDLASAPFKLVQGAGWWHPQWTACLASDCKSHARRIIMCIE